MWIYLSDAFLSIVQHTKDTSTLLVRARFSEDINRIFPEAQVIVDGGTDYAYRAIIARTEVVKAITEKVEAIDYPNFKNSVKERSRHDTYLEVWDVMYRAQQVQRR